VWAKTEKYRDAVLGFVIINVDENHISLVDKYLSDVGARWEVLTNE